MLRPYRCRCLCAEQSGQLSEEKRILRAAAGDDELVDFVFGEDEAIYGVDDGERGEKSCGAEEVVEQRGNGAALLCEGGVFVEALAAVGEVGDEGVDEHVAGAGVEGEYLGRFCVGGNDGDVGDAA